MHMSTRPGLQKILREEVQYAKAKAATEGRSELTCEEINCLPYLDAVVVRPFKRPFKRRLRLTKLNLYVSRKKHSDVFRQC